MDGDGVLVGRDVRLGGGGCVLLFIRRLKFVISANDTFHLESNGEARLRVNKQTQSGNRPDGLEVLNMICTTHMKHYEMGRLRFLTLEV